MKSSPSFIITNELVERLKQLETDILHYFSLSSNHHNHHHHHASTQQQQQQQQRSCLSSTSLSTTMSTSISSKSRSSSTSTSTSSTSSSLAMLIEEKMIEFISILDSILYDSGNCDGNVISKKSQEEEDFITKWFNKLPQMWEKFASISNDYGGSGDGDGDGTTTTINDSCWTSTLLSSTTVVDDYGTTTTGTTTTEQSLCKFNLVEPYWLVMKDDDVNEELYLDYESEEDDDDEEEDETKYCNTTTKATKKCGWWRPKLKKRKEKKFVRKQQHNVPVAKLLDFGDNNGDGDEINLENHHQQQWPPNRPPDLLEANDVDVIDFDLIPTQPPTSSSSSSITTATTTTDDHDENVNVVDPFKVIHSIQQDLLSELKFLPNVGDDHRLLLINDDDNQSNNNNNNNHVEPMIETMKKLSKFIIRTQRLIRLPIFVPSSLPSGGGIYDRQAKTIALQNYTKQLLVEIFNVVWHKLSPKLQEKFKQYEQQKSLNCFDHHRQSSLHQTSLHQRQRQRQRFEQGQEPRLDILGKFFQSQIGQHYRMMVAKAQKQRMERQMLQPPLLQPEQLWIGSRDQVWKIGKFDRESDGGGGG